ncbi:ribokinase [Paenibacillus protaetiae]|uniref:Ribokinase n=1 Tax=Paenibacillus protaetiae TaxID=2509456 RepID=A0A4P6ERH2_9BACL|nr:ribokinase [Paenibacillus protaetiae]QAY65126.1 ribokinase [Paenibacillus protaetiae]
MGEVIVVGSINMDLVSKVEQFPLPGQTIHSHDVAFHPGGKGANQAVAASRAGAVTRMIGAVGSDAFGQPLIESLKQYGVSTEGISVVAGVSGLAFITVSGSGENQIVLCEGANGQVSRDRLNSLADSWTEATIVLLQNEIPWAANEAVLERASEAGARVFYNPAPAAAVPDHALAKVHTLFLNETETEAITGQLPEDTASLEAAAGQLLRKGARAVVITLGADGCYYADAEGARLRLPAFRVQPVDTTAAGDTFIGAYAAAVQDGKQPEEALKFAAAASAIGVTREGAQSSVPSREEIEQFLIGR